MDQIETLRQEVQQIIDLIAAKQLAEAIQKHAAACELLDELIDHADSDEAIVELSRYQVLLNHLHQKIYSA